MVASHKHWPSCGSNLYHISLTHINEPGISSQWIGFMELMEMATQRAWSMILLHMLRSMTSVWQPYYWGAWLSSTLRVSLWNKCCSYVHS